MNAEILCVGTELLLGDIINTNASYIAKGLALCGINCYYQTVVGDNPARLKEALALSLSRSDILIMTGGLGPTYDDLTKETVAEYFGRKMELHKPSLEKITCFFHRINRHMTHNNEKQAYMPEGAIIFDNDRGTAPGLAVEGEGKTVILMPGPPREMNAMFDNHVIPYLLKKSNTTLVSHNVHMFGIGESALEDILAEKMKNYENPTIAPYAKEGEVLLRVTASAKTPDEAEALIIPVIKEIEDILSEYIYGIDVGDLQSALVKLLTEKSLTIATAESCTGGLISQRITQVSGASQVFGWGVCTYANEAKMQMLGVKKDTLDKFGAVSEQTAIEMAKGVRKLSGADIGVSVTGIAGPDGGTEEKPVGLVYIGLSSKNGEEAVKLNLGRGYGGERQIIRNSAASNALNLKIKLAKSL